jgi:Domain of unknown function (DUF932)
MTELHVLKEAARWRSRDVRYLSGSWGHLRAVIPAFELSDFHDSPDEPANPFLRSVIRLPVGKSERRIPVGVVSNNYMLVQHVEVGDRCISAIAKAGVDPAGLRCEIGLSELDEWMNLRLYLPERYSHRARNGGQLDLRVEAFNSVDGSARLTILSGWFRFVCSNGLVIGKSLLEVRDVHNPSLDLVKIEEAIAKAILHGRKDRERLTHWQNCRVDKKDVAAWVDGTVADCWGKKAACRVFHICDSGRDMEPDPFVAGSPSAVPAEKLRSRLPSTVPGAVIPAQNRYDVSQALSWVATQRTNPEKRVELQAQIAGLVEQLKSSHAAHAHQLLFKGLKNG